MQVTGYIQLAVRLIAETENYLTSVERIDAYANLPSEANPITLPGIIQKNWPSRGEIEFIKYTMTYRLGLPPVLNEISFKVNDLSLRLKCIPCSTNVIKAHVVYFNRSMKGKK